MTADLGTTIAPKSDQLNADDLLTGPRTIRITRVEVRERSNKAGSDQPCSIFFEGDNGKPYKPGLSMRRVLLQVWGRDGDRYVGRSLTLYRDEKVAFGGANVGGIRISHMSDISEPMTMSLTASKASRKPYTVQPLDTTPQQKPAKKEATQEEKQAKAREKAMTILAELRTTKDVEATMKKHADMIVRLGTVDASIPVDIRAAMSARAKELSETDPPSQAPLIEDTEDRR